MSRCSCCRPRQSFFTWATTPGRRWFQLADLVIGVVLWRRRRRGE